MQSYLVMLWIIIWGIVNDCGDYSANNSILSLSASPTFSLEHAFNPGDH